MLYYHDPMASAAATQQLVNDLDLTVIEPGGTIIHQPLVLDISTSGVGANATEGADRLNNIEQVVINNPIAGTYTVSVADFVIPEGPQEYVVVYDFVPNSIKLSYPIANTSVAANNDLYIYWDAPNDAVATTKIEFTDNNGASWTTLDASVPANQRYYKWAVPTINSNQCKIRITRAALTDVSGSFVINQKPVVAVAPVQCPGSIAINWTSVPSVDKYYLMLKKGAHLSIVDSVNASTLSYTFKGLSTNLDYFVAVMPSIGGMNGYRSNAATRKPNSGNCAFAVDGDLAIEAILSPQNGRRSTSSELKTNSVIKVNVRNQDNDAVANYSISYQVNSKVHGKKQPLLALLQIQRAQPIIDTFDFSDTVEYQIKVAVENLDKLDPISANDTLVKFVKHIPNKIITLTAPKNNDFEAMSDMTLNRDTIGFSKDGYWDYTTSNQDTGRLRTRIPGSKLVSSTRSISLDVNINNKSTVNYLTGTFNLSNYDTSIDEVRLDFDYEMRGMPIVRDSNRVWVRGSDLQAWIPLSKYSNAYDSTKMHNSGTIFITRYIQIKRTKFFY